MSITVLRGEGALKMRAWITLFAASVVLAAGISHALAGERSSVPVYPPYPYKAGHYPTVDSDHFRLPYAAVDLALLGAALLPDGAGAQPLPLHAAHLPGL